MRARNSAWKILAAAAAVALLGGPVSAAQADEPDFEAGFYVIHGDERIPVPDDVLIDDGAPTSDGEMTPYLISFPQWTSCYTFNNANETFAT